MHTFETLVTILPKFTADELSFALKLVGLGR